MTIDLAIRNIPRLARPEDAVECATILNRWIDARDWMPRVHSERDVERFYEDFVFRQRKVWVVGTPLAGFMAMDEAADMVMALYVAQPGLGIGKALLDHAKRGRNRLELWTFVANTGARHFYHREGFREIRRTAGENEEGLPDVLFRWERGEEG